MAYQIKKGATAMYGPKAMMKDGPTAMGVRDAATRDMTVIDIEKGDAKGDKNFTEVKWIGKNVLLFGSEGFGMREHTGKYTDFLVKIDINNHIESLNISNSAAIVFHHLSYLRKN